MAVAATPCSLTAALEAGRISIRDTSCHENPYIKIQSVTPFTMLLQ
jgi:hypothetical protein